MKLKMSKEWLLQNIDKEDKAIVSAGSFSLGKLDALDESTGSQQEVQQQSRPDKPTLEKLAKKIRKKA
jgi:hypothetical protein